jgi:hypothetical protein
VTRLSSDSGEKIAGLLWRHLRSSTTSFYLLFVVIFSALKMKRSWVIFFPDKAIETKSLRYSQSYKNKDFKDQRE